MADWDNIQEWGDTTEIPVKEDRKLKLYKKKTYKVIEYLGEIGLPEKNEQIRLISRRQFNTAAFIKHVSDRETIEHAILVIFTMNKHAVNIILDCYKKGRIKKISCLVSSIRNAGGQIKDQAVQLLVDSVNKDINIYFANSHAKITCLKTADNYYCVEGSGNMSDNGRIEQYVFDNDKQLYDFTEKWIDDVKVYLKDKKELKVLNLNGINLNARGKKKLY